MMRYECATVHYVCVWSTQKDWASDTQRRSHVVHTVLDTFVWQALASVIIPGFTINRICYLSNILLRHTTSLPPTTRKWTVTAIGLSAIPFIIHPIDHGVHFMMNKTVRQWTAVTSDTHQSARDL